VKHSLIAILIGCESLFTALTVIGQQAPGLQMNNGQYNGGFNVGPENMFV